MLEILIGVIGVFVLIYFLYWNGIIPITVKSAVTFIGGLKGKSATFTSCSGYMKRIIKLEPDCIYQFILEANLTNGSMGAEILDHKKQTVLTLDQVHRIGEIKSEKGTKYRLILRFQSASGEYKIDWTKKESGR